MEAVSMVIVRKTLIVILLGALALFAAADETAVIPDQAALTKRVAQYWEAYRVRDWATVYQMESGARTGTLSAYAARSAFAQVASRVLGFEITSTQIEGPKATVTLDIKLKLQNTGREYPHQLAQDWIAIDGEWYRKTPEMPPEQR
jgi:hypothetical protein